MKSKNPALPLNIASWTYLDPKNQVFSTGEAQNGSLTLDKSVVP